MNNSSSTQSSGFFDLSKWRMKGTFYIKDHSKKLYFTEHLRGTINTYGNLDLNGNYTENTRGGITYSADFQNGPNRLGDNKGLVGFKGSLSRYFFDGNVEVSIHDYERAKYGTALTVSYSNKTKKSTLSKLK
jgi:hypothetical protein